MKHFSYLFTVLFLFTSISKGAADLPKYANELVAQFKELDKEYLKTARGLSGLIEEEKKTAELVNQCKSKKDTTNCVQTVRGKIGALEISIDDLSALVQLGMAKLDKLGDQLASAKKLQTGFSPVVTQLIDEARDENMKLMVQSMMNSAKVSDLGLKAVRHRYAVDQIEYFNKTRSSQEPAQSQPQAKPARVNN